MSDYRADGYSPPGWRASKVPSRENDMRLLGNIIWILIGGLWLAVAHLVFALLLAITIIGIPFAVQHLKLARLSLTPYGKMIVVRS
jgi:uncharacterized membrane protein YccF (DUF307 family)